MTGTTSHEATSGGKVCAACGTPLGEDDDKRYANCGICRDTGVATEYDPSLDYEPIEINVDASRPPPAPNRSYYWCGATFDCPMDITLGGIEFPKTIGRIKKHGEGKLRLEADYREGQIHWLTDIHREMVKEHAANRVVRDFRTEVTTLLNGETLKKYHGKLKSVSGNRRNYIPDADDKPVGQFVYMIRVKHADDRPIQDPPTMVPRDW